MQTDYIDLMLIHQPFGDYYGSYLDIAHFAEIKPAVNQVETHVFQQQKTAREYMAKNGTQIMSWGAVCGRKKQLS